MDARKPEAEMMEIDPDSAPFPFDDLPDDLKFYLRDSLDKGSIFNLARASWSCRFLYKESYTSYQAVHASTLDSLRQLLSHTALGEWDAAAAIWSKDPSLLSLHGTVFHPNPPEITPQMNPGRYKYVNHTAWQIAMMNEEYDIAEEMGNLMTVEEKQKQFAEVFPDGKLVKHNWNLEEAKRRLEAVFAALIVDQSINETRLDVMSQSTREALYTLYDYVKPVAEHRTGLVFDASIYVEALRLYENRWDPFKTWDQRSFWCIRVEEHLAALLGTAYLRPHAQGVLNPVTRTGCILADNSSYFAFRRSRDSVPGGHFFVGLFGGLTRARGERLSADDVVALYKLCRAKTRVGQNLRDAYAGVPKNVSRSSLLR